MKDKKTGVHNTDLTWRVAEALFELGVPAKLDGYRYLKKAIPIAINDLDAACSITKVLYPQVAKECNSTSARVERAIRHAIEVSWERGDLNTLRKWFGNTVSTGRGRPTNSEFIAMVAEKISLELKTSV